MTPALLTQRLLLRPLEHEDSAALADLLNRPEVARGLCTIPRPFTPLHASAMILMVRASESQGKEFVWAVENGEGDVIGQIGLREIRPGCGRLGYALLPEYWGQGLGREALQGVLSWAERQTALTRIEADAQEANPTSRPLLERLGFVLTGRVERFSLADHGPLPFLTYELALTSPAQLHVA